VVSVVDDPLSQFQDLLNKGSLQSRKGGKSDSILTVTASSSLTHRLRILVSQSGETLQHRHLHICIVCGEDIFNLSYDTWVLLEVSCMIHAAKGNPKRVGKGLSQSIFLQYKTFQTEFLKT
jgi:hypothetical protein